MPFTGAELAQPADIGPEFKFHEATSRLASTALCLITRLFATRERAHELCDLQLVGGFSGVEPGKSNSNFLLTAFTKFSNATLVGLDCGVHGRHCLPVEL